jgi:hypothetical protein
MWGSCRLSLPCMRMRCFVTVSQTSPGAVGESRPDGSGRPPLTQSLVRAGQAWLAALKGNPSWYHSSPRRRQRHTCLTILCRCGRSATTPALGPRLSSVKRWLRTSTTSRRLGSPTPRATSSRLPTARDHLRVRGDPDLRGWATDNDHPHLPHGVRLHHRPVSGTCQASRLGRRCRPGVVTHRRPRSTSP